MWGSWELGAKVGEHIIEIASCHDNYLSDYIEHVKSTNNSSHIFNKNIFYSSQILIFLIYFLIIKKYKIKYVFYYQLL